VFDVMSCQHLAHGPSVIPEAAQRLSGIQMQAVLFVAGFRVRAYRRAPE